MNSDLTFFTNEPDQSLLDRFKDTLPHVEFFDVLVGYFRTSGFHLLYEAFAEIDQIRILVGLNVDRRTFEWWEEATQQMLMNFESAQQTMATFAETLTREMEQAPDNYNTELGVKRFIELIQAGRLQIKAHPSQNIHAKVYISRFGEPISKVEFGKVITGSSNFSQSGLVGQFEFNVELKHRADVEYALEKFEALWAEAVDLSEAYIETINRKTWLNDQITPYELYLKFLYEYFKEDINLDQELDDIPLPPGFMELQYQRQAVLSARKILEAYNGVFLADVVGLGKTFISAMLAQHLPGRKLIICPPVLQDYWERTFRQFNVAAKVESLGKLDRLIAGNSEQFDYIFVDEAHRFRNEGTQRYEMLHQICWGKKVILVSATPLNNKVEDIFSQLKLFQSPNQSQIPGMRNLTQFFDGLRREINQIDRGTPEYTKAMQDAANEVRNRIFNHVMVRRTRKEIAKYFSDDMEQRGLFFPELANPERIIYRFDEETDRIFTATTTILKQFNYARYTPLLYLTEALDDFEAQSQRNIGAFMKGLLVKRLESSFFAFKQSLDRFITSYERFIDMVETGTIYIGKNIDIAELLDRDDDEYLQKLLDEERITTYPTTAFNPALKQDLDTDLVMLQQVQALWQEINHDPKLEQFINELHHNPRLKNQQALIFTESAETGAYLYDQLNQTFPDQVMFFRSGGGIYRGQRHTPRFARDLIEANFNPDYSEKQSDIRLLITTDVLAEGINLHRANLIVNYDLPWNPTRVLQRVGRVNRVGTKHGQIFIFNFFPTDQGEAELGLEENIKGKIQAFHDMLGEDAKYLTEEEDVSQHELFGDRVYRSMMRKPTAEDEAEGEISELEYLRLIQQIRDDAPNLFEKVKRLPKKARAGWGLDVMTDWHSNRLLTFFRKGRLKKFFLANGATPEELTFLDAASLLQCEADTPRQTIPKTYYDYLSRNKDQFAQATSEGEDEAPRRGGGQTNEGFVLQVLKAKEIRNFKGFTDIDDDYLKAAREALEAGIIPRNTSKRIREELNKAMKRGIDPLKLLQIFKNEIPDTLLFTAPQQDTDPGYDRGEVILSAYLKVEQAPE